MADLFLSFGEKNKNDKAKFSDLLDFEATYNFLKKIILNNNTTINRQKYNGIGKFSNQRFTNHVCDYCHKTGCNNENASRLPDGLIICNDCKNKNERTDEKFMDLVDKALQIHKELWDNSEWPENIKYIFDYGGNIAKEFNINFKVTPQYDYRALGYATHVSDISYYIYVEKYRDELDTLLTIIHELTHIWQFENKIFQNISKEYKAFYTEGMTVWSEIQYLKFLYNDNPDPIYLAIIESQSHREDIYGEGYRQVIKDMEKYNYDDVFKFAHDAFIKKIIELDELK